MSELILSFLIAVAILAAMFALVPMLDMCNARCQRLLARKPNLPLRENDEAGQESQPFDLGKVA